MRKGGRNNLGNLYCVQLVTDGSGGCVLVAGDAGMMSMYCQAIRLNAKGEVLFNAPYHDCAELWNAEGAMTGW